MPKKRSDPEGRPANPSLPFSLLACPHPDCADFNRFGAGNLSVCERMGKDQAICRLYCHTCLARFSERQGSLLAYTKLPAETVVRVIKCLARAQNCRITKVEVVDSSGRRVILSGERFRLIVGSRKMPSTWCTIRAEGQQFVFCDGRGLGHGVGMCQYGAEGYAQRGYTAKEILELYYPGAKLARAY